MEAKQHTYTHITTSGGESIAVDEVVAALRAVKGVSGRGGLETDLRIAKMFALDAVVAKAVKLITRLVALEASGKIQPAISLFETYMHLDRGMVIDERRKADRRRGDRRAGQ